MTCLAFELVADIGILSELLGGCTFPIVSDPKRTLYKEFGMTFNTMSAGQRPNYVQRGSAANVAVSLKRNLTMPLKSPGDLNGLGGEFVVGPGLDCAYAHRMRNTRDHAELGDILKAIGITMPELKRKQVESSARSPTSKERKEPIRRTSSKEGRIVVRVVDNPDLEAAELAEVRA